MGSDTDVGSVRQALESDCLGGQSRWDAFYDSLDLTLNVPESW